MCLILTVAAPASEREELEDAARKTDIVRTRRACTVKPLGYSDEIRVGSPRRALTYACAEGLIRSLDIWRFVRGDTVVSQNIPSTHGSFRARNVSNVFPPRATLQLSHSTVKPAAVKRAANALRLQYVV